ncbi:MAG: flagellar protein FlgN [Halanaerobiaceae bacterium]|jgi:hypothetical protein|nr:flagellar protein FlgN [Halanaerobiaceae bacterium]
MTENIYNELLEVLTKEYELYCEMKELADKKKDALIENSINELVDHVKNEEDIIEKVRELEGRRNEIIINICDSKNVKAEDISFQELIKLIPDSEQEKMLDIREKLLDVIDRLQEQNEQNKLLVTEAINLNNVTINMFLEALEPENAIYDMKQKAVKNKTRRLLDRKG